MPQHDLERQRHGAGFDEGATAGLDLDQTEAQVALKDSPTLAGKVNTGYLEATLVNYTMMKTDGEKCEPTERTQR